MLHVTIARVVLAVPGELEYVMVAVPKPAGCEPLNPLSGWDAELVRADSAEGAKASGRHGIYREEHDDHSAFFLDHPEAGEWEIRFTMRAVTAGDFRVLPVQVEAMYAPEVRANSDARRVRIEQGARWRPAGKAPHKKAGCLRPRDCLRMRFLNWNGLSTC